MCLILLACVGGELSGNERKPVYGGHLLGCADDPAGCRPEDDSRLADAAV